MPARHLARPKSLTRLRNRAVRQTGVSPSVAKRLVEALPKCKILN